MLSRQHRDVRGYHESRRYEEYPRIPSSSVLAAQPLAAARPIHCPRRQPPGGKRRTQCAFECDRRGGASMRFHPKSRASIDNRPGPSIVSAPAIVADSRRPCRSSPVVRIPETATTATTAPANGVHNPTMRRSAASASDAEATIGNGRPLDSPGPARQRTTAPTTSRINSKAIPGQPPANVEYKRRNRYLNTIVRRGGATAPPTRGRGTDSLGPAATGVRPDRQAARRERGQ
jgi:hypothetical protein